MCDPTDVTCDQLASLYQDVSHPMAVYPVAEAFTLNPGKWKVSTKKKKRPIPGHRHLTSNEIISIKGQQQEELEEKEREIMERAMKSDIGKGISKGCQKVKGEK